MFIVLTGILAAQDQSDQEITRACKAVENLSVPAPSTPLRSSCNSARLYYGADGEPDHAAAAKCALAWWAYPFGKGATSSADTGVLIMVYANGDGAPRNLNLAIRVACLSGADDGAYDGAIKDLVRIRTDPSHPRYDFCASANTGGDNDLLDSNDNDCSDVALAVDERHRNDSLSKLMLRWSQQQRAAYEAMRSSQDSYVKSQDEIGNACLHGWGSDYVEPETENDLNDKLLRDLTGFEAGRLPSFNHQDYLAADKALNAEYAKVMADLNKASKDADSGDQCPVTTEPDVLRTAERAWIAYRDAWVAFAAARWPHVSADSWLTLLTQERTQDLDRIE